jgi:hypothetical protein
MVLVSVITGMDVSSCCIMRLEIWVHKMWAHVATFINDNKLIVF